MIFIDPLFFEYEPNKIANVFGNNDVKDEVARFIGIYEKQCLKEILGECLYKDVQDSYRWDNGAFVLKDDADEWIVRLVNGYDYDASENSGDSFSNLFANIFGCGCGCGQETCVKRSWKGFVQTDEVVLGSTLREVKKSFIAEYVYYHYLLLNRTTTAATGQQVLGGENSVTVQNFSKRIDRYNEFVFSVIGGRKGETSLYRFIHDNRENYPTWAPGCNIRFKDKW